jgi:hypothetical protein
VSSTGVKQQVSATGVQQQVSTTGVLNGCPTIGVHSVGGFQVGARMGQGNFIMISFVRGFAPDSAHALPIAGFGQGSLLARNLTWGLARRRTLPSFNDRGTLRGECLSVWGLEGPTSTSADLFNVSGAPTRDESSLGRRLDAGGGPLEISGSPCSTIIITSLHGSRGRGFQVATGQLSNGGVRKNCGRLVWLGAWGTKGARVPGFQGSKVPGFQGCNDGFEPNTDQ